MLKAYLDESKAKAAAGMCGCTNAEGRADISAPDGHICRLENAHNENFSRPDELAG